MTAPRIRIEIEPSMSGPTTFQRQTGWWVLTLDEDTGNVLARKWVRTRGAADHYAAILRNRRPSEEPAR